MILISNIINNVDVIIDMCRVTRTLSVNWTGHVTVASCKVSPETTISSTVSCNCFVALLLSLADIQIQLCRPMRVLYSTLLWNSGAGWKFSCSKWKN